MATNSLSEKQIQRHWHLINAKGKVLGRLATEAATLLMGKHKPYYVPYLDTGDHVVIINAADVRVTGKKDTQKQYVRHSGYPGGLKVETFAALRSKRPEEIVIHAVKGMVPKTKLGRQMMKKLHVYAGTDHPYKKQLKEGESHGE